MIVSETDKAYIAGLIDGEGSICILRSVQKAQKTQSYGGVVQIRMTNKEPVYFVSERYGGKVRTYSRTSKGRVIYDLKIYSRYALAMLKDIKPFLKCKGRQAAVVEALYEINSAWGKTDIEKEVITSKRITLMNMCKRLNQTSHSIDMGDHNDC